MTSIYQAISELEQKSDSAALCTVVKSEGSTPRHVGSKMLVYPDGHFLGTVGGGELESRVVKAAVDAIQNGNPQTLSYSMVDPTRGDPGVCGGTVEVFVEPILPPPLIVVIGGGHVGQAVVHLAKWLGFRVAVSDDRLEFSNPDSVPGADAYYPVAMQDLPDQFTITNQTYFVITSRGSPIDASGLPRLLQSPAAYIGVIGSKRRWLTTVRALVAQGIPETDIQRVHSPIGLELQAETPQEIAVSILAEILMIRNRASGQMMKD